MPFASAIGRAVAVRAAVVAVACLLQTPARADIRILASPGGTVAGFLQVFETLRASGERIVIDGPCLSACTLVLVAVPADRICVTRRAVFGFHAAQSIDRYAHIEPEPEASHMIQESYPSPVRAWIERHGGLTSRLLLLRGRQLTAMFPRCR